MNGYFTLRCISAQGRCRAPGPEFPGPLCGGLSSPQYGTKSAQVVLHLKGSVGEELCPTEEKLGKPKAQILHDFHLY